MTAGASSRHRAAHFAHDGPDVGEGASPTLGRPESLSGRERSGVLVCIGIDRMALLA
jgi:hypothetical protein